MRTPCVAGNWKMHKTITESISLAKELRSELEEINTVNSIICPPFTALAPVSEIIQNSSIHLGAQNLFWEDQGAYTGEISPLMIKELAEYVIVGHSERRTYFFDTDEAINKKVLAALKNNIKPILCVGETLEENESGQTGEVIIRQLSRGLQDVSSDQFAQLIIAYEPVWAIGTGKAATPEGANFVIQEYIRKEITRLSSPEISDQLLILYGGSVNPENAKDFFVQPDIDGALVGGASLKKDAFIQITQAAA